MNSEIRDILLKDWDPTDAARNESARTTYDGFIDPLREMIQSGASEEAIVDYLFEREHEIMCFPGMDKRRLRRVAQRLIGLKSRLTD